MTAPVAITCGEPAGIGPEIATRAVETLSGTVPAFWIGDPRHLPQGTTWAEIGDPCEVSGVQPGTLPVLAHEFPVPVTPGAPDLANAKAVCDVIARAVALVQDGVASALCTAPIHKKILVDGAQFAHPGHTEYLAALTGAPRPVMMLASPALRVVPVTIHIALEAVSKALTPDLLRETIEITVADLRNRFGIQSPRVAVAGLNPHAGEGGAMGRQELDWIGPLLEQIRTAGFDIMGPASADTLFHAAARDHYDVAIAMYHDQALIPIKTLDFDRGVNITLGLPIIRTSPDHGTAFDIAGRGTANPTSMIEALKMAWHMANS